MPERQQITFGSDTWALGSRGKAGSFRNPGLPMIRNLRMLNNGSLVVRPAWFRWGWFPASESYLNIEGHDSSTYSFFAFHYYRSGVLTQLPQEAVTIMDEGGVKVFDRANITSPLTEFYSDTSLDAQAIQQFGFGNLDPLSRYDILLQGNFIRAQGVGANDGAASSGRIAISPAFIPGPSSFAFVGSTFHQGRAFYWGIEFETADGTSIRENRIWYSDPYAYTTFSQSTQYFDVDGEVRGAVSIGPNLIIWTVEGNWFVLQGRGDPARGVKHTKGKHRIPNLDDQPARFGDIALFNSSDFDVVCIIDRDGNIDSETLARFGGPELDVQPPTVNTKRRSPPASSPLQDAITVPLQTLGDAIHLSRGVWVEETWDITGITLIDRDHIRSHSERNQEWFIHPVEPVTDTWEHQLYYRDTIANKPSKYEDVAGSQPAETVDGELWLPRVWDSDFDSRITQVTVDARYWKDTVSSETYDTLNLEMRAVDSEGATHVMTVGQETTTISGLPDADRGAVRITATPADDDGLPFVSWTEVQLFNIRSFAIEQVMVEYEITPRRAH